MALRVPKLPPLPPYHQGTSLSVVLYALGRDQDSGINLYWYAVRILLSGAHVNYIVCAMGYEYYLAVFMSL